MAAASAPPIRLAVDCMGGDHGPSVTLPACRAFLAAHPAAELILVGRAEALKAAEGWERCTRVAATEVVEMSDSVEKPWPSPQAPASSLGVSTACSYGTPESRTT